MLTAELTFSLQNIQSTQWRQFEQFASQFLASEMPNYRNMASTYGDKGRDGEVYCEGIRPHILVQLSVSTDWEAKVKHTVKRLRDNFKNISKLIYATSQEIGPCADELKWKLLESEGFDLDIRDRSWFVDRMVSNAQRETATEELIASILNPLLATSRVTDRIGQPITEQEARIGLLHLALETSDKGSKKGLTRSSYESLTLAALHDTSSSNRISLNAVQERVAAMLPAVERERVEKYVESSLSRLSGKRERVKHWNSTGEYCLSNGEVRTLRSELSGFLAEEERLVAILDDKLCIHVSALRDNKSRRNAVSKFSKEVLEEALLVNGEAFATRVAGGDPQVVDVDQLREIMSRRKFTHLRGLDQSQVVAAICTALADADVAAQRHLRRLADAYTLFAFLRQTPDVQKAIVRLFSEGDIWLDTTVVLPLLTETLVDHHSRTYSNLLAAASSAGLNLYVTSGVIEEVDAHLRRAVSCSRKPSNIAWHGRIPFVYSEYINSGGDAAEFPSWLEEVRGPIRPEEDIVAFLTDRFHIKKKDLKEEVERAPDELRIAATEYWYQTHERRRNNPGNGLQMSPEIVRKLVEHDVECTVGVLTARKGTSDSPLGYSEWWLCLDRAAQGVGSALKESLPDWKGTSPVLNPDFLTEYLRLGPLRDAIEMDERLDIPVLAEVARRRPITRDLIDVANQVRQEQHGLSERVVRRRVRDSLDEARASVNAEISDVLAELDAELAKPAEED